MNETNQRVKWPTNRIRKSNSSHTVLGGIRVEGIAREQTPSRLKSLSYDAIRVTTIEETRTETPIDYIYICHQVERNRKRDTA